VSNYLRHPHLTGDRIVFVADDDVWIVDASGGRAERLTADRAPAARPRLSPDGTLLAWTSARDGNNEVYVAPVAGGEATRLTYWNHAGTRVLGWSADGRVIVATPALQPFRTQAWGYALPTDGGPGERLPLGPINGLARRPDGAVVVQSVVHREPATWKRYRGGTRPKLWIDRAGSGEFERLLAELDGQLADPVWLGDRLAFVSDHEGHGNVYSVLADGTGLRRHSDHTGNYARDLAGELEGGSAQLVYQRAGVLYRLDSLDAEVQPVAVGIELPGARAGRQRAEAEVGPSLGAGEALSVDASGRASVVNVHGTVQWLTHRDGPVRALADTPGVRTRLPRVVPGEAARAVWVTDADGDDALELAGGDGTRRFAGGQLGRVLELVVAPDGATAAVASHDGRVLVADLAGSAVRVLESNDDAGNAQGLVFSPDSAWLAWSHEHRSGLRSIRLADLAAGEVHDVTGERFVDTDPAFTLDGKHLAFLSARTFDPVYDAHVFDMSFTVGVRPYLVPLAADTPSPFDPEADGRALGAPSDRDGKDPAGEGPIAVRVDLDGLAERAVVVPVPVGLLSELRAVEGGLLWLTSPITGVIGAGLPEGAKPPRPALTRWDFADREARTIVEALDWYRPSGDGKRIVVRDGDVLRVGPADHQVRPEPQPGGSAAKELVEVDLDRVQVRYEPPTQWRQMMIETWRLMRDHFWIADMGGVDWDDVLDRYLPLIDRIATRSDLSEVLWEMIGELGASHAYERFEPPKPPKGRAAAFLGADLERTADGDWVLARVLPGESSVPAARSPLRAAGAGIETGDVLVAVNGRPVGPDGPGPLLAGLAGKPIALTVRRGGEQRAATVVPTHDETQIRYQDWVSGRRAAVHARTDGRAGYVHVPDMVATGWAEFHRDLKREILRDALLVDTRDNGGGHVSELVIEKLARRPIGGGHARHYPDEYYPSSAPRGPLVSVANEYAGSDGDIVNQAFRSYGLGPIVGMRTWGGVIGIDGRYSLVDGTVVTQPRFAFWFRNAGWGVENHGVDPDIEVPFPPQAWAAGDDPQLEAGVQVLLDALASATPLEPTPIEQRPDRAAPPLPPRP
jgi:tricorn protease